MICSPSRPKFPQTGGSVLVIEEATSCSGTLRIGFSAWGGSLKGCIVLIEENKLPSPDMGVTDPLLTETPQSVLASLWYFAGTPNSGTPPPLGIKFTSPKMRDLLLNLTQNFGNRTNITKRMPVLVEIPSRGEEGDSTRTEPVSA